MAQRTHARQGSIGIVKNRKILPESPELFDLQLGRYGIRLSSLTGCQRLAIRPYDLRPPDIVADRVLTHPVHTNYIALILDSSGMKQRRPGIQPNSRPVGHIDSQIIILVIATEDGKAKIIADLKENPEILIRHDDPLLSRSEMHALTPVRE